MEHGGSGVSGRWPPTLFLCRQEPSTELPYNICVVRENLFRTRITRTNTDKKETLLLSLAPLTPQLWGETVLFPPGLGGRGAVRRY